MRDNKENKIESWDLSGQGINAEIAKVLAEYLSASAVLTTLDISRNEIGEKGAAAIAEALCGNKGADHNLNLGHNNIGPEGTKAIGEALAVIKTDTSTL